MALPTIDPTTLALASAAGAFLSGFITDAVKKWRSRADRQAYKDVAHELKENGGDNLRAKVEAMADDCKAAKEAATEAVMAVRGITERLDEHAGEIATLKSSFNGKADDVKASKVRRMLGRR